MLICFCIKWNSPHLYKIYMFGGKKKKSADNLHVWIILHEFDGKGSRLCNAKASQTRGTGGVYINFAFSV